MVILKIIGLCLLAAGAFILLNFIAYWQVTRDMTPEEKEKFLKHIEENGFYNDDDIFH